MLSLYLYPSEEIQHKLHDRRVCTRITDSSKCNGENNISERLEVTGVGSMRGKESL